MKRRRRLTAAGIWPGGMRVKRIKLLLAMAACVAVLVCAVYFGSPYAAPVEPYRPIEEIWAIEDERQMSETPLVTALSNNGAPLAYDAEANTFYCTLGMEQGGEWPDIKLTAPGSKGVTTCFVDDYTYDACSDAIAGGYSYELMTYTDDAYDYTYIVFTGLPVISVRAGQGIGREDTPVHVQMSGYGEAALDSAGLMHVRGASTITAQKPGYLIEFTRGDGSTKSAVAQVPGMGAAQKLVLLALTYDETKMRDRLSWDIYAKLAGDAPFGARRCGHVELLIDGRYEGLYLMIEPFDEEQELARAGSANLLSDSIYRTAVLSLSRDRLCCEHPKCGNMGFELFHTPLEPSHAFDPLDSYFELVMEEDDAVFAEKALACMDMESLVRMELMVQAGGMTDNFYNNLYVWAAPDADGVTYRLFPWDMDLTWGLKKEDIGEEFGNWMTFGVFDRMIDLDVGGIRARMNEAWKALRTTVFDEGAIEAMTQQYARELNDSGAMTRNAARWNPDESYADGFEIQAFCSVRFALMDALFEEMAAQPERRFECLTLPTYEEKAWPIDGLSL